MNRQRRPFSNAGGYLLDCYRLARGIPINLHSYMKFLALRSLAKRTAATCLIETGTFLGVTSARCARVFDRVLTVELDAELATQAASYLRTFSNVEVFQGDVVELLPRLISRPDVNRAVVFLDAHFSGGDTARGDVPEPALLELKILATHKDRICGIVIDDFRSFGTEPGIPKKSELLSAIETLFPFSLFEMQVHADQVFIERRP